MCYALKVGQNFGIIKFVFIHYSQGVNMGALAPKIEQKCIICQ